MDYKDFLIQKNIGNHFWYKSRRDLINGLFGMVFENYNCRRLILEIGCGVGYQIPILRKWGVVEGFDINPDAVNIAIKNGFHVKVKDVEKDNIDIDKFDVICLFDVLEHIKNDNKLIKKICDSLKNEAFLFLSVPAYNFLFSNHDRAMNHFRRYNKKQLVFLLEKSGFKIIKSNYWNFFLFPCVLLMRLLKSFLNLFFKKESYQSEASDLPILDNRIFYKILMFENYLIKRNFRFPFRSF